MQCFCLLWFFFGSLAQYSTSCLFSFTWRVSNFSFTFSSITSTVYCICEVLYLFIESSLKITRSKQLIWSDSQLAKQLNLPALHAQNKFFRFRVQWQAIGGCFVIAYHHHHRSNKSKFIKREREI